MGPLDRAEDKRLVLALRAGDEQAFGRLYDRWFDRVHDLARRITRDDALAADVAQDAFLAAWQRLDRLHDPASFGGWLLRIARNRALDVVRSPARARTQADDDVSATVDEQAATARLTDLDDPATVAADREVQDLLWSAAATLGERDLTALDLSLRHGLEPAEIGEVLGINRNAANQLVHRMKGRLATAVRSRVLWRGGRPDCPELRQALVDDGLDEFDARAVRVTERHAEGCDRCSGQRRARLDPAALFAAVPITIAPVVLKAKAAAALEAVGVPMGGSSAAGRGRLDGGPPSGGGDSAAGGAPSRRIPRRAVALAIAAALVIALVVAVVAVERLDHDDPVDIAAEGTTTSATTEETEATTTTEEGSISISIVPDDPADAPASGDDPVVVPDPGPGGGGTPPPPPPPPPPAPTASIGVSPSVVPPIHPSSAPATVSWSTSGATTVSVSGPGIASSSASGSQAVCPGTVNVVGECQTPPGSYTYVLTASGPGGNVHRTTTLTVA